jgi:probable phosphoglycerate mutase
MLRIVLIRPGATELDEQGRIKGTLDIPLSEDGARQAARLAEELEAANIEVIYTGPCRSAIQTGETLAAGLNVKLKQLPGLRNLDHGLWHGKLIEEVRQQMPKLFRLGQMQPDAVCPPEGETLEAARQRAQVILKKVLRKHKQGVIALVISEPLASLVASCLDHRELEDLWKSLCDSGCWEQIDIPTPAEVLVS